MNQLTPNEIVLELDKFIVGQEKAKRAVSIALRNRWRRQQAPAHMRDEIVPNNIILIGTTGVGKTEIARRLANLAHAPFLKVEASKFTEVGYVGRDVESIIRDLTDISVNMVRKEKKQEVLEIAGVRAEERLLDLLFPPKPAGDLSKSPEQEERYNRNRLRLKEKLEKEEFEDKEVEVDLHEDSLPMMQVFGPMGMEDVGINLKEMMSNIIPGSKKRSKLKVSEARHHLVEEEVQQLIDQDEIRRLGVERAENNGIVFLDEIDKIVGDGNTGGPDVSREGVQRDLLPIIEGSSVPTKYGMVRTDHMLFISAGAFHVSTPSDMIPELQGRFPIRVEMDKLTTDDFIQILTSPRSALIKQYQALMAAENVELVFNKPAIKAIAETATLVNSKMENIGARRLHTIMTTLLEDILFDYADGKKIRLLITKKVVGEKLDGIISDRDLSRYIL